MKTILILIITALLFSCSTSKKWVPGNKAHFEQRKAYKEKKIQEEKAKADSLHK